MTSTEWGDPIVYSKVLVTVTDTLQASLFDDDWSIVGRVMLLNSSLIIIL